MGIYRTHLYIDVRLVAHGLVPLTLRQNDILTFEKWRPFYTIWKKDAAQTLHKRASFAQCFIKQIVLFRSARFKGSLLVRPGTLWTYVLTPSRRTSRHPLDVRPQSQGRTSKGFFAGEFDVLCLLGAVSSLSEKRVFSVAANYDWFYRILRAFTNVKKKVKYKKNRSKWHLWISSMGE